jgi:hypothetical protein
MPDPLDQGHPDRSLSWRFWNTVALLWVVGWNTVFNKPEWRREAIGRWRRGEAVVTGEDIG